MFDNFLEDSFYEFPSFKVAMFSILLAFVLSTLIAFTYKLTYRGISYSGNFFQSMVLASTVTSMVIMAVGNNVAAGFGIIGAIAIIRFRTRINDPRNIMFIFASLSVGIATGVYGYSIAISGTLVFCSIAFMLYFSPHGRSSLYMYSLTFNLQHAEGIDAITAFLEQWCESHFLMSIGDGKMEDERYEYQVSLKKDIDHKDLYRNFCTLEGINNVKLNRRNNTERL